MGPKTSWHRSTLLVLAITLHNIPEGLAVGVAFGAVASGIGSATIGVDTKAPGKIEDIVHTDSDSNPGYDEFRFLHSTYSSEFKNRSKIISNYGIVDTNYDPASAPFTSGRPLLVSVSPVNPLTVDISAGFAVTPSNLLINIDAAVPSVPLKNC